MDMLKHITLRTPSFWKPLIRQVDLSPIGILTGFGLAILLSPALGNRVVWQSANVLGYTIIECIAQHFIRKEIQDEV